MSAPDAATRSERRPRFSLVSAVYNVAPYLEQFIASIEAQTSGLHNVQMIVVDDGSTDDSLAVLESWQRRRPELVTVLTQPNGGQGSARNLGMQHAEGEWISFPDPDDILEPDYLAEVDAFLKKKPAVRMIATNRITYYADEDRFGRHPLHRHFTRHNRFRDLENDSDHFHGSAPCAFFPLDELRRQGLTFDPRIRPNFEDGHFCCSYLLRVDRPLIGFLATARYLYRKRIDRSSTLDRSWSGPGRFVTVPEYGYLAVLRDGAARNGGRPPAWLQAMVIYELSWYLKTSGRMYAETTADPAVLSRFHELLVQVCALLDEKVISAYAATRLDQEYREILSHGYAPEPWRAAYAQVDKVDRRQRSMRLTYRFTGPRPGEVLIVDGAHVRPFHEKVRDVKFFDKTVLHERIVWLPLGTVRVLLDGRDVETRVDQPEPRSVILDSRVIRRTLDPEAETPTEQEPRRQLSDVLVLRLARSRLVQRYFGDAWVLVDRIINADDSAEHLFRYLRKHRRHVNSWFVVKRGSADYERLRKDGYRRIVPHGSIAWKLLMLNAAHLISSHVDHPIVAPEEILRLGQPRWRFTFLQHGVIKDDLSNWLNGKDIDLFVTSTPQEQESIAGDHSAYRYTTREAVRTGLPRFDRVRAEGARVPPEKRNLILIAPTWRQWLIVHAPSADASRTVDSEQFAGSEYARQWSEFLNSSALRDLAERTDSTICLLMHPNLQGAATLLDLPPYVQQHGFEGENVQRIFAQARVLVTDYSSMAFNAAYIDRPLVYFQFDRDRMFGGGHVGRRGYYEYERDGFGPVALTVDDAVMAVTKAVDNGPEPEPEYARRITEAFPDRDGKCCERTAKAIAASTKALKPRYFSAEDEAEANAVETPAGTAPEGIERLQTDDPTGDPEAGDDQ